MQIHTYILFLYLTLLGDRSQLKPLKKVCNKTVTPETLFDLKLSKSMKSFTILGQHRASNSYLRFLGTSLFYYISFLVFNSITYSQIFIYITQQSIKETIFSV